MVQKTSLTETFYEHFDVLPANTVERRNESFRLRKQVYCIENNYEPLPADDDIGEQDSYDARSVHSIVRHRVLGITAATVRLVLPSRVVHEQLPIEDQCAASLRTQQSLLRRLPVASTAEISRFAVSKHFKRRSGEAKSLSGVSDPVAKYVADKRLGVRFIPHITLGLFVAIVRMSLAYDVTHWYAVMEPSLLRLLNRFGIVFHRIGELVDYHGPRQPCFGAVDEVLLGIWEKRPELWALITDHGQTWPLPNHIAAQRALA